MIFKRLKKISKTKKMLKGKLNKKKFVFFNCTTLIGLVLSSFWNEKSEYTPESRIESARIQEELKRKQEEDKTKNRNDEFTLTSKKERKFFDSDGKPYSFNDPK
jgi:hypothetical protein